MDDDDHDDGGSDGNDDTDGNDDNADDDDDDNGRGESSGAVDAHGIPGWDKVDALARALLSCSGLSVTNEEARNIKKLYGALHDFDKKPLSFTPRPRPGALRGRFGRSKSGHTTIEQMKR